jgi:hypothetical protein
LHRTQLRDAWNAHQQLISLAKQVVLSDECHGFAPKFVDTLLQRRHPAPTYGVAVLDVAVRVRLLAVLTFRSNQRDAAFRVGFLPRGEISHCIKGAPGFADFFNPFEFIKVKSLSHLGEPWQAKGLMSGN